MNTLRYIFVSLTVAVLAGCATTDSGDRSYGMLSETAGKRLPAGFTTAVIYEIDGERVFYGRGQHRVTAGRHVVRVWPESHGPRSATPIPGAHANAEGIRVEPLVINVEEGARYYVAAIVRRHRVFTDDGRSATPLGPWRTTILPVVVRDTET